MECADMSALNRCRVEPPSRI